MITLHNVNDDVQNEKPNDISLQSHPAFIKQKQSNMRKKIEPCLKRHGFFITN